MRRLALLAASCLVLACARQLRSDTAAGTVVPARLIGCGIQSPDAEGPAGASLPEMSADFQIDPRGKVRDVHVQGGGGADARALRRHLESCEYSPATRNGHPIATRRAAVYGAYR